MADFLTRLASRTLGLAPLAEPLVPPLYATETAAAVELADDARPRVERPADRPPLPPRAEADAARPSPAAPARIAGPREVDQDRPPAAAAAAPIAAARPEGAPSRPRPAARPTAESAAVGEVVGEDALLLPARRIAAQPPEPGSSAAAPARPLPPELAPRPPAGPGLPIEPPRPIAVAAARDGDDELLLPLDPTAARSAWALPPGAGRADRGGRAAAPVAEPKRPRGERSQPAASAAAAPTIEITIGRVEVRALQPPAPAVRPQPAASAAPRLSLEEYLRNQNGGRR